MSSIIERYFTLFIIYSVVFPIFLYGAEIWTSKITDRKRIDAFEIWCGHKMLCISRTARRINLSILERLNISKRLLNIYLNRTVEYFDHIARQIPKSLERLTITWNIETRRPRERSPMQSVKPHPQTNTWKRLHRFLPNKAKNLLILAFLYSFRTFFRP